MTDPLLGPVERLGRLQKGSGCDCRQFPLRRKDRIEGQKKGRYPGFGVPVSVREGGQHFLGVSVSLEFDQVERIHSRLLDSPGCIDYKLVFSRRISKR